MPRTITIDNVQVVQIRFMRDPNGALRIYGEYALKSGNQVVSVEHVEVTGMVNAATQSAAGALLGQIAQAITVAETA